MSFRNTILAPRFAPSPLSRSLYLAFAAFAATALMAPVRANPLGGVVVSGQANIAQPSAALTQIRQSSDRAVIDWRSFSIGAGEAVRFNQPSATSAALNRVVGNEVSNILGSLSANGRVYLVNQNGIFVGRDAQVDAAALVLSTANVSNSDFMAGRLNFNQPGKPGARIVNEGSITAADGGLVAMVAPGVENRGVISARLGQVILAGAPAFSLDLFGDGLVNIVLSTAGMGAVADAGGKPLSSYVDHSGRIVAEGGRVWISAATARGLVDGMVNISGDMRATRVAQQGGEITLLGGNELNISGNVTATGSDGKGGGIAASADKIVLASNALLDASGATGGGSVLVGGGYQGASPVSGASATAGSLNVATGASIKADATGGVGNGGLVVLWSENDTRFAGSVSARAGAAGGDGGLMEVSGKKYLAFDGQADASATKGAAGTLLLDPGSLTVAAFGAGGFGASGSDSIVAAGTVNNVLRTGTSVTLQADDNITINSQIDGRTAADGVAIPGGGLSLAAGGAVSVNSPIVLNDGAFTSNSATFTQADGNVIATLGGKPISISATGNIATQYLLTGGDVNLSSAAGNVTAARGLGGKLADGTPQPIGNLTVLALQGNAAIANGIYTGGNATFNAGSVQVGQAIVGGDLRVAAGSGFQLQGDAQVSGSTVVTAGRIGMQSALRSAGNINLDSATSIELSEEALVVSNGGDVTLRARSGHIQALDTIAANLSDPAVPVPRAGNIVLDASGDIGVRQLVALGGVDITSAGGSVNLNESLGGTDESRPLVGSLYIKAGRDVTTNGLNLAGSATGGDGLRVEAGANGQGGHIYVNDRIGVSKGHLQFGSSAVSESLANSAILYQSVYARDGNQNITFNVPVVVDGTKIAQKWQQISSQPNRNLNALLDMVLIPVISVSADRNPFAESLVVVDKGGLRVAFNETENRITDILQPDAPDTAGGFWMIPKIVISNQEIPRAGDKGVIRLAGGEYSTVTASGSKTAAIKIIVPSTQEERAIRAPNPDDPEALRREFSIDVARSNAIKPTNLILNNNQHPNDVEYIQGGDGQFVDAALLVNDYTADGKAPVDGDDLTKPVPISVILYEGFIGTGRSSDLGGPLPGREFGFSSNSNPVGFTPVTNVGGNFNLSAQIIGALPPAPTAGLAAGSGQVVAAVSVIENRAGERQDVLCPDRQQRVVGRSAGDEADVGVTTALRGAPPSVFLTSYVLGDVSEQLTTADSGRIAGANRSDTCR